ncbi:MAG TPA: SRPBCC domain-containing protein [Lacunisphaera sp.]|nr:SRPBCC domain-containing protein [Lacunisphaera sp.]
MSTNTNPSDDTAQREIILSRVLTAPRELVWEAWTNPEHVVKWWGPRGFTNATKRHDFRVGGYWEHTMIGPDGTRYPNKSKFLEIVPLERIVYLLGGGREDGEVAGANFTATWTFEVVDANTTKVTGTLLFPTKEARDHVVREFGAIEGGRQTLERLGEQLAVMRCEPFVVAHEFAAPRDLVWRTWTEPEHFRHWFGPKGASLNIARFEVKPGGMTLFSMTLPGGQEMWVKAVYREIAPPAKLVWVTSPADQDGATVARPMWPRERLTVVTFAENAGKTTVTVRWLPLDATAEDLAAFDAGRAGAAAGWSAPFEKLTTYLSELQTPAH